MKYLALVPLLSLAWINATQADTTFKHDYENGGHWSGMQQASTVNPDPDASHWVSSELAWNEEYGVYDVIAVLHEDVFQERMVWSDHYGDMVPAGMAYRAVYDVVKSDSQYSYKMVQGELVPCIKTAHAERPVRLAILD